MTSMANETIRLDFADNPSELGIEFNSGINLEIRLSDSILARMAGENYETTFILGYDPAHGVTLENGFSRRAAFSEDLSSRLTNAQLVGPQESQIEQRTTAEPPQDPSISREAPDNDPDQADDEEDEDDGEWLNAIAASLVPVRRPKLPDQDPLGKLL